MSATNLKLLKETLQHLISVVDKGPAFAAAAGSSPVCSRTNQIGDTTCIKVDELEALILYEWANQ